MRPRVRFNQHTVVLLSALGAGAIVIAGSVPASAATGTTYLYGPGVTTIQDSSTQGNSCHNYGADNDFYTNVDNESTGGLYIYLDAGCNNSPANTRFFPSRSGYQSLGGLAGKASSYKYSG